MQNNSAQYRESLNVLEWTVEPERNLARLDSCRESNVAQGPVAEGRVSYCLLFLFRETEETIHNENRVNEENRNTVMPSSTNQSEQPSLKAASDEELYSGSMSLDSEVKRKMAEFDGRANLLKAQFPHHVDESANKKALFADCGQDSASVSRDNGNLRGNEMAKDIKLDGDKFREDSKAFLDDKKEDVRIEKNDESENNSYSSVRNNDVKESYEESSAFADEYSAITSASDAHSEDSLLSSFEQEAPDIKDDGLCDISEEQETGLDSPKDVTKVPAEEGLDVKSVDGCMELAEENLARVSFTSVSELSSDELSLSSCDQEVADINDGMLSVSSENEDYDPDSWDALDDITLPCCRSGKCTSCLRATVFPCEIDDGLSEKRSGRHEELVAAVVNISEHHLQRETLNAFKAAPLVQNSREFGDSNAKHVAEERHSDEEKRPVSLQEVEERNKALKEVVNFTNRENEKLMDQVIAMKEEAKTFKMERKSLQSDLETVKLELKRLKDNEKYKERELSNLRDDMKQKVRKLKDVKEELDYAQMDKNYLLYNIDLLEEKLKESEERSEELNFRVDELNITIEELETTTTYGRLREEVELLKGSLGLSKHREEMLECQLHELKEDLNASRDKNAQIINKQQVIFLAKENSRLKAKLSKISANEKNEQLRELKGDQERVIMQLRNQLSSAEQENSWFIELKAEKDRIIKQMRDQLASVEQENSKLIEKLNAEKLRVSQKEEQLDELKEEQARTVEKLQEQLVFLESENVRMTAELSKVSEKDNQLKELKEVKARITAECQNQVAQLKKENAKITAELSRASENVNQLNQLQDHHTRIAVELQEQVANLEEENARMFAELSKASDQDKQLSEGHEEKTAIKARLPKKTAKLKKEKSKMVSKMSDKERQLKDVLEQLETLRNHSKCLHNKALEAQKQLAHKMLNPPEVAQGDDKSRFRKQRKRKCEIIKLKKRVQKNEREIELLGRFVRQRGGDTEDPRVWQEQQVQQRGDMEKELQEDLQLKTSLLFGADVKHEQAVKQLEDDLQRTQKSLKEKELALEKAESDLQSSSSLITSLKANVCQQESELEGLQLVHKSKELELERVKTSLDEHTKWLDIYDTFLAEANKELASIRISLNRKSRDVEQMKFSLEPTQDELKLVLAELGRPKSEKVKYLHDTRAANSRMEEQKFMSESSRNFLQELINSAMKDQEAKANQLRDVKMNLNKSRIRISRLESEKRNMEECKRDYKEKVEREINRLKQALKASVENNTSFQSRIVSAKQEKCELRWENQKLKVESLQKYLYEMAQSCGVDVSSRPLMVRCLVTI